MTAARGNRGGEAARGVGDSQGTHRRAMTMREPGADRGAMAMREPGADRGAMAMREPGVDREAMAIRYVGWLERHGRAVLVATAAIVAASMYLAAFHLPLHADLSDLLPTKTPAIRDLRRLEARVAAKDTMVAIVVAPDAALRAATAGELADEIGKLDGTLVARVDGDDAEVRAFVRAHAALYVPLADLVATERALAARIADAKLRANPLYIDLDDAPPDGNADGHALDELRGRRRDAEARLARSARVSPDDRAQVIVIETAFRATDAAADRRLQTELDAIAARVRARHPAATVAFAGGVPQTLAEHDSLVAGMLVSSLATAVLVALVLFVHLRSLRMLALLTGNIAAATLVAFGLAALTVGHLNAATAFLGAIIAGNGINYGILLVARFLEERRAGGATQDGACAGIARAIPDTGGAPAAMGRAMNDTGGVSGAMGRAMSDTGDAPAAMRRAMIDTGDAPAAMARAIAGTLRPTLIASLGAAIAYGALAVTQFRGFADFAVIGGLGMLVCWVASFVVLPVLVLRLAPGARGAPSSVFGRIAAGVFGFRRPAVVCALGAALALGSVAVTARYLAHDPFEYDMAKLRSDAPEALALRGWMAYVNRTFGRGLSGMSRSTYIAVDDPAQVPAVVAALGEARARDPIVGPVQSILDAVPPDQPAKLRVLAQIRTELDEAAGALPEPEQRELAALRPSDDLAAFTAAELPEALRARLTERDGRLGTLVAVTPGPAFDEWNGHDLLRFAGAIRELHLPDGGTVTTSGPSVIFADILTAIRRDGAVVTACASAALAAMVLLLVGRNRRALAVLAATGLGSLAMIAICALVGLRINFLDFVALPIALGLGIDYAINIADRADRADPRPALRSTGGSVLVCSLTTIIGYASLLVSSNLAIRGFGLASLIGEVTCAATALALVPAICALGRCVAASPASAAEKVVGVPQRT